ncbi:MAG: hypothetical protein ACI9OD_004863, partial [Limisphaerales bacterium]
NRCAIVVFARHICWGFLQSLIHERILQLRERGSIVGERISVMPCAAELIPAELSERMPISSCQAPAKAGKKLSLLWLHNSC